ncbi:MAG TPA: threonine synthase [Bacteroidetes bacterium]|nr:threonine synthase [Bacteroidota bacterium]
MKPNSIKLKCSTCGTEYSVDQIEYTCPLCGPLLGTLDVIYNYTEIGRKLTKDFLRKNPVFSLWRYLPILPVSQPTMIPDLHVGWTPVYRAVKLEEKWGVRNIRIKNDGVNPTASFKDRASAVAIVKAKEQNVAIVTAASTGNAASSWAAFAAISGLKNIIFVPKDAPRAKVAQLLIYGAEVLLVNGTYDDAFDLCCAAAEKWGWYNRSTAVNPYLAEGKKTAAFEICEQLEWEVPDYVFVPVGDGCIIQSVWKGFCEFYQLGLITRLPKLIGVQAEGSAPLVAAWENGASAVKPVIPKTVADSIAVGVPRDQLKALRAVRESGGMYIRVSDRDILSAIPLLARTTGVFAEPAAAAGLAGLRQLIDSGICKPHDTSLVLVTGNGLKDVDNALRAVENHPIEVENTLSGVAEKLSIISNK